MTGFSSSSATREQGHATGLYSGIGVYPCSASLGFRGSPTPHPQEEATSQPTSSMKDLFCSFMDCVSAFNPTFAAKFAPSQACRGSIPAALGAPPPVSVSSASTPPPPRLKISGVGRRQCQPLLLTPTQWVCRFRWLLSRVPVSTPPLLRFRVLRPLRFVSRPRFHHFPFRELGCGLVRLIVLSHPLTLLSRHSRLGTTRRLLSTVFRSLHTPLLRIITLMTQVRNFTQSRRVWIQRQLINRDELGQVAVKLLRKYLDQIYNPVSAQPSGVNSASVSDAGFFQPPPTTQSGIAIPPDFLTKFDRVNAKPNPHPLPSPTAPVAFPVSDEQARSHLD